jgi:hypothetical protein
MHIRTDAAGCVWIPRRDPGLEAQLDNDPSLLRMPGQLRWKPIGNRGKSITEMADCYVGMRAVLCSKGRSLDSFLDGVGDFDFDEWVVCAINEAGLALHAAGIDVMHHMVAPELGNLAVNTKAVSVIVSQRHMTIIPDAKHVFHVDPVINGKSKGGTASLAFYALGVMGVKEVYAVGFDGRDGDANYAEAVTPYTKQGATSFADYQDIEDVIEHFGMLVRWNHLQIVD